MMKIVSKVVWVVTALAALHIGLTELGFNFLSMLNLGSLVRPLHLLIGLAGAASLAMFFIPCVSNCCE